MDTLKLFKFLVFSLIVLQCGFDECVGYNILCIFPSISYSHQKPMLAVSEALARKGHNVTAITLNPNKKLNLKNYRQIDAHSLYGIWEKLHSDVGFSLQKRISAFEVVKGFVDSTEILNRALLYHPAIDGFAREIEASNATYDVVIYEAIIYTSLLGMVLQNGKPLPPTIGLLTLSVFSDADWYMGNPLAEAYVPTLSTPYTDRMSFFQRIDSLMVILYTWYQLVYKSRPIQDALMKERFGANLPSIDEIESSRSMLFYLNDFTTGYLRPVQQNTVFVGPINVENQPVDPLPQIEASNATYDVVIYEAIIYTSLLGMVLQNGKPLPPTIGLLTLSVFSDADWYMGNPLAEAYVPTLNTPYTDRMSFFQRIDSLMVILYTWYQLVYKSRPIQDALMKERFGANLPSIEEIESSRSMLFYLNDFTTGYLRPVQQNTVFVGPINVENQPVDPLPQDLQKWMDEAEEGVIYFSLGSNMKGTSFPADKRAAFIDAFSRLDKIRVLWKWEEEKLPNQPNNTMIRKWLPQNSILAHPKTKLFISQMGHQSSQEAINFAVPLLGVPIYGDQIQNALKLKMENVSILLDIDDANFNSDVHKNIQLLLNDSRYKQNMLRLQKLSKDKPMSAAETAVWWVEYVARHKGAPHLRPAVLDLPWYQIYLIDILLFFVIVFSVIIVFLYILLKMLCCNSKDSKKVKVN